MWLVFSQFHGKLIYSASLQWKCTQHNTMHVDFVAWWLWWVYCTLLFTFEVGINRHQLSKFVPQCRLLCFHIHVLRYNPALVSIIHNLHHSQKLLVFLELSNHPPRKYWLTYVYKSANLWQKSTVFGIQGLENNVDHAWCTLFISVPHNTDPEHFTEISPHLSSYPVHRHRQTKLTAQPLQSCPIQVIHNIWAQ